MPEMTLDTDKPVITVEVDSWEEFRYKTDMEYRRLVGKGIDWEKSEFMLWWVILAKEPQKITVSVHVPINIDSTEKRGFVGHVAFSGYIKGYIVECE